MAGVFWWSMLVVLFGLCVAIAAAWIPLRKSLREKELKRLYRDFHHHREHLEAHFFKIAANSGKPRGLAWTQCEFEDDVIYARDKRSGEIRALVGITISFEAVEGGGMEEIEFVTAPRDATAVFRVDQGKWITDGRAIMNLNPTEAVRHFQHDLELVGHEPARA